MRFVSIVLIAGSISFLSAQKQTANPQAPSQPSRGTAQKAAVQEKLMEGILVSVDKSSRTFTIKLRGKDYPFQVSNTTNITINKARKTLEDLSSGAGIRVTYTKDAKQARIAQSVTQDFVQAPRSASAAVKKPESSAAAKPVQAAQPAAAAAKPVQTTAQPAAAAAKPVQTTAQPAAAAKPVQTTAQPAAAAVIKPVPAATAQPAPIVAPVSATPAPVAAPAPAAAPATVKPAPAQAQPVAAPKQTPPAK